MENREESFEDKLRQLETIVAKLETGDVPLEKMMDLYDKGQSLYRECNSILSSYEKRLAGAEKVD